MKDTILSRLNGIADLDERRVLKTVMNTVFSEVVHYNLDMYEALEKRIYDELDDPLAYFYIDATVMPRQSVDAASTYLHPMVKGDVKDIIFDMAALNETLKSGKEVTLTQIFMECDYMVFKEMTDGRKFKGFVHTDKDVYEILVMLRQSNRYTKVIENLYRMFQYNGQEWHTINCPYAYKYVDVLLSSALTLKEGESISAITIELSEFEPYKRPDFIPLWNIDILTIQDKSFPMPAKDQINYEHVLSLRDLGMQNGFLVAYEEQEFDYVRRTREELTIVSRHSQQRSWQLLRINNSKNSFQKKYAYELLSNERDLGFIGRYASVKAVPVRTKGEIARIVHAYAVAKEIELADVLILDQYLKPLQTQDYNPFIDDKIRRAEDKKVLLLTFKTEDVAHYLVRDKMSFLTSQIQLLFPEYHCIGELV